MTNHPRRLGRRKHQRQAQRMVHGYAHGKHPRDGSCITCRFIPSGLFPFEHRQAQVDISRYIQQVRIGNSVIHPTQLLIGPAQ